MVSGSLWLLAGNSLQQVIQFLIFIALARLLTPSDFGFMALAMAMIEVLVVTSRGGIVEVIVQQREVDDKFLANSLILTAVSGMAHVLLVCLALCFYGYMWGHNLVSTLMLWATPIILLQALGSAPEAVIRRRMGFKWLALRNNVAALLGGLAAILFAWFDAGVYALLVQRLINVGLLTFTVWIATPHLRSLCRKTWALADRAILAKIVRQNIAVMTSPLAGILGPRIMDGLIGTFLSPLMLGYFKLIWRLFDFIAGVTITPLSNVAQSALPKLSHDRPALIRTYLKMLNVAGMAIFPLFTGAALTADIWIPLMLGRQWAPAVPYFQTLSFVCFAMLINYFQIPVMLALKKNRLIAKLSALKIALIAVSTIIGLQAGLAGVVTAYLIQAYVWTLLNMIILKRLLGLKTRETIDATLVPISASLAMVAIVLWIKALLTTGLPIADLAMQSACGALCYVGLILWMAPASISNILKTLKKTQA